MTKEEIIFEIKRTATENEGKPLGAQRFRKLTGIPESAWRGKYWRNWSNALEEAGIERNEKCKAYDDDYLISSIILLAQKNRQFPTYADMRFEKNINKSFPNYKAIMRLGTVNQRIRLIKEYIAKHSEYADVLSLLPTIPEVDNDIPAIPSEEKNDGFVYIVKEQFSKQYKIGKTFDVPRRHREIALELPGDLKKVHSIRTDDPAGIEYYWHKRFEDKRTNGEWFALTPDDIRAFKRRKFM